MGVVSIILQREEGGFHTARSSLSHQQSLSPSTGVRSERNVMLDTFNSAPNGTRETNNQITGSGVRGGGGDGEGNDGSSIASPRSVGITPRPRSVSSSSSVSSGIDGNDSEMVKEGQMHFFYDLESIDTTLDLGDVDFTTPVSIGTRAAGGGGGGAAATLCLRRALGSLRQGDGGVGGGGGGGNTLSYTHERVSLATNVNGFRCRTEGEKEKNEGEEEGTEGEKETEEGEEEGDKAFAAWQQGLLLVQARKSSARGGERAGAAPPHSRHDASLQAQSEARLAYYFEREFEMQRARPATNTTHEPASASPQPETQGRQEECWRGGGEGTVVGGACLPAVPPLPFKRLSAAGAGVAQQVKGTPAADVLARAHEAVELQWQEFKTKTKHELPNLSLSPCANSCVPEEAHEAGAAVSIRWPKERKFGADDGEFVVQLQVELGDKRILDHTKASSKPTVEQLRYVSNSRSVVHLY